MDYFAQVKTRDPYIFKKADDFFADLDRPASGVKQPAKVHYLDSDQLLQDGSPNPACSHGRVFRFNDNSLLLVQFMRPRVWRIRFHAENKVGGDFTNYNTRTIVQDTLTNLIDVLDAVEQLYWTVELIQDPQYLILQSVINPDSPSPGEATTRPGEKTRKVEVQLWIQRDPFKIIAIRSLKGLPPAEKLPRIQNHTDDVTTNQIKLETVEGANNAIIWQTKERGLQYAENATVLSVEKAVTADYMGFGEQGGKSLFKAKTFMNYFNFDNMRYQNVYENGPLDDREPLYHSEPYWIEVDALPGYKSQIATFIDNYSHVCVDVGVTDPTAMRVATRFNDFQCIVVAGDDIREIIQLYTSIIGRPSLKPRYVLGYHQGCYGYDTQELVLDCVDQYRKNKFPIDGMHIDVDVQDDYRTFTINTTEGHFPQPEAMFKKLRDQGVKCSTNITPYINSMPSDTYRTLNEGLEKGYFVTDNRDIDPSASEYWQQRYLEYGYRYNPNPYTNDPTVSKPDYFVPDMSNLVDTFNKGNPFHGGVYYGWGNGHPGVYPNLNNEEVRRWWGRQYQYLFESGLEFVWQDMTSPCMAEQYGDMKSFPFRLLLEADGWSGDPKDIDDNGNPKKRKAIEIWSLYSYNLHKATFHGLNNIWTDANGNENTKLTWRKNRRNFIIGRGSFAGMHRYAGLWTGDNASTWEFLDISVVQVLSLGLSGVTISGADVGGFEFIDAEHDYANPELLVRWYGAYSLLPWFRNHYTRIRWWADGRMRKDGKFFQEPYEYQRHYDQNKDRFSGNEAVLYRAVLPTCRWLIRLRYSLMQLLYDAMFENMITGLPIARAMCITDELDRSLFSKDNQCYTRSQYLVRQDLLVAPALEPESKSETRMVYLPYPDEWFQFNLRPDDPVGLALTAKFNGGTHVDYGCPISDQESQIPYTTPMFIREGAIIPKIEVRDYVPDPTDTTRAFDPNPITIHVYPGKDSTYDMYLDDGISRDSAPTNLYLSKLPNETPGNKVPPILDAFGDHVAQSKFTHVQIRQATTRYTQDNGQIIRTRRLTIKSPWNQYGGDLSKLIGNEYTVVFWHEKTTPLQSVKVEQQGYSTRTDEGARATIMTVPVQEAHVSDGVVIDLLHQ